MKTMTKILSAAGSLALLVLILLLAVNISVFDMNFYERQYRENHTAELTAMSENDLKTATEVLLGYVSDQRDDLDFEAEVGGIKREVFDAREKAHMVDVKALFAAEIRVCIGLAVFAAAAAVVCRVFGRADLLCFAKGFRAAAFALFGFFSVTGIMMAFNFSFFWELFHHIFFTNDLFRLDPKISIMINMFPSSFFLDMCVKVILISALTAAVLLALSLAYIRYKKKNAAKDGGGAA